MAKLLNKIETQKVARFFVIMMALIIAGYCLFQLVGCAEPIKKYPIPGTGISNDTFEIKNVAAQISIETEASRIYDFHFWVTNKRATKEKCKCVISAYYRDAMIGSQTARKYNVGNMDSVGGLQTEMQYGRTMVSLKENPDQIDSISVRCF